MLHNIPVTCPLITKFMAICYVQPVRLFVVGNHEMKLSEGITQRDTSTMGAYALGVTPLNHFLSEFIFY